MLFEKVTNLEFDVFTNFGPKQAILGDIEKN